MIPTYRSAAAPRPRVRRPRPLCAARGLSALLLAVLPACGGDGGGGGTGGEPVAAVTVSGAPAAHVMAGTTVQLTATPTSASGAALSGQAVTWASGDTAIAKVSSTGLVNVTGAGLVAITARAGGSEGSATLDARVGGPLGPAGGTLDLLGGRIRLVVPAGSLRAAAAMLFRPATAVPAEPRLVPGTVYELGPQVFDFNPPATLTLAYDPARIPAGVPESTLQLYTILNTPGRGEYWDLVRESAVDVTRRTVSGPIHSGGRYAIVGTGAQTVSIVGELAGGAIFVGQTRSLAAVAVSAAGDTLHGRTFAWTTSDATRATVDGSGKVTGLAAGQVSITAALDGQQASVTINVLPAVTVGWTHTGDWSTHQGSGRHDAHVSSMLDPAAFRELWTKTIPGGLPLNAAATGAGKVHVSQGSIFVTTQRLTVLDAATGEERWARTFTGVRTLSGAAFGGGRVYLLTPVVNGAELWSLDAEDGTLRFRTPYGDAQATWPAPVVSGGGVFTGGGPQGGVMRFDAVTGAPSWHVPLLATDRWSPAVVGDRVLVYGAPGDGFAGMTALNAADGSVAATLPAAHNPSERTPVLGSLNNVLATSTGALTSTAIQAGGASWSVAGFFPRLPVVGGGTVYTVKDRVVAAYRESDGTQRWTWTPPSGEPWVSMVAADNLVFVTTETPFAPVSRMATFALDAATGRQVWTYPAGGHLSVSAEGTLFIATQSGTLVAIALR